MTRSRRGARRGERVEGGGPFVAPWVQVDAHGEARCRRRRPDRLEHAPFAGPDRVGRPDLAEDAGPDAAAIDAAVARLDEEPVGDVVDRRGGDPRLVHGLEVVAGPDHDVQAGALGDGAQPLRVAAERRRRELDDRLATGADVRAELVDRGVHVGQSIVVRVHARVPARLGRDLGIPGRPVRRIRRGIAVDREQRGRVHPQVLVRRR